MPKESGPQATIPENQDKTPPAFPRNPREVQSETGRSLSRSGTLYPVEGSGHVPRSPRVGGAESARR